MIVLYWKLVGSLRTRNPRLTLEEAESLILTHLPDILAEMILSAEQDAKDKDKARIAQEHAEWSIQAP